MRVYWKCQLGPVWPRSLPFSRIVRGSSPTICACLAISRFACARSSSVVSAGNGNSAVSCSLIGGGDGSLSFGGGTAQVGSGTFIKGAASDGLCDHGALHRSQGRELPRCLPRGLYLFNRRGHDVFHSP